MKSILDPSFEYTPGYEADIQHIFARVRRELAEREDADADSGVDRDSPGFESNGDLVDAGLVNMVDVRMTALVADGTMDQ